MFELFRPVFDIDPEAGAGGAGDEAPVEKIEVSKADYEAWQETQKILGDNFDKERYAKIKDIDPDEYQSMKSFTDIVDKNEEVYDVVKEMLTAKREGRAYDFSGFTKQAVTQAKEAMKAPGAPKDGEKPASDPNIDKRFQSLEQKIEAQEAEKYEQKFVDEFEKTCSSLGKMTEREKGLLRQSVEREIINNEKLSLKDVATVVKGMFEKEIKTLRQEITKEYSGKLLDSADESPDSLRGGSPAIPGKAYDPKTATASERVSTFSQELRANR